MRHILFLASWYPNSTAPALGNFVQQHARAAALKNTVSVVFATADENLEAGELEIVENHSENLHEYLVYYGKIKSNPLKRFRAYKKAMQLGAESAVSDQGKPGLVHLHVAWRAGVAAVPIANQFKVPLVITEHWSGYLPEDGRYSGIGIKRFTKRAVKRASHITAVSNRLVNAMMKHGLQNRYSILANCVDTDIFRLAAAKIQNGLKLLHVSMLVEKEKNISGMLHVMKELKNKPGITLQIIGDGPERKKHEAYAKELGLSGKSVFFAGYKSPGEIAVAMQEADALLMFSHFEGMPVTIIEALSSGLPVIATKTGSIPEMVDEFSGMLVDPGNEDALEEAILDLYEKKLKFDAVAIREKAVARYSYAAVAHELDRIYSNLLNG
jgi:glycosyltransferase involved in cell wall biosynthesis